MAKAAASTINWLPIGIAILVPTLGFLAFQHYNISDQNYDLNREMGEIHGTVNGLEESHAVLDVEIKSLKDGQENLKTGQANLKTGQANLKTGQTNLTTTLGRIETRVDGFQIAVEQLRSNACVSPPCETSPDLVLKINDLVDSTPDWFIFAVNLPIESSPIEVNESSMEVNETVYNASWVREARDLEQMDIVPWRISVGPIQTHVDRQQIYDALRSDQGIRVFNEL